MDTYLNDAAASPDYVAKNGFLNDLVSSGNLGLIKNNGLRGKGGHSEPPRADESEHSKLSA